METCPKCGYARQPADTAPAYECPKCGVIYAKYLQAQAAKLAAQRETSAAGVAADPTQGNGVSPKEIICTACGALGDMRIHTRGSLWIEIVLWLTFIVPGLVYSIWRMTTRDRVCGSCGSAQLITIGSPVGKKLFAEMHPDVRIVSGKEATTVKRSALDRLVQVGIYAVIVIVVTTVILAVWLPAMA